MGWEKKNKPPNSQITRVKRDGGAYHKNQRESHKAGTRLALSFLASAEQTVCLMNVPLQSIQR